MKTFVRLAGLIASFSVLFAATPAVAGVDDFSFESFDATYNLSLNPDTKMVQMKVTEVLVADFPASDQNHGIRRNIPDSSYGEFPGFINVISVSDETGAPRDFSQDQSNGFVNLAIKPADGSFVHEKQTYVIKYEQSWVVKSFEDSSGFDEFYWDVNGTGWNQKFGRVTATVNLDSALAGLLVGDKVSCYQGVQGSKQSCVFDTSKPSSLFFSANNLQPRENLTVAVPFKPGVINVAGPNVVGQPAWIGFWVALAGAASALLSGLVLFLVRRSKVKKLFIVPQYRPSPAPGLLTTAVLAHKSLHVYQASIIELAVQHVIEIEQRDKDFILRRLNTPAKNSDQEALLELLGLQNESDVFVLAHRPNSFEQAQLSSALTKYHRRATKAIAKAGFYEKLNVKVSLAVFALMVVLLVGQLLLAIYLDSQTSAGYLAGAIICLSIMPVLYLPLIFVRNLSPSGVEVVTYFRGLGVYIDLAESDRLEFLQSPSGAGLEPSKLGSTNVLKLYEELLPWAILLGKQKQWNKVLNGLYEQHGQPVWFVGVMTYNDAFSSLNQSLTQALAVSSSGGAGGGGSSGGGGGGGGGGGI